MLRSFNAPGPALTFHSFRGELVAIALHRYHRAKVSILQSSLIQVDQSILVYFQIIKASFLHFLLFAYLMRDDPQQICLDGREPLAEKFCLDVAPLQRTSKSGVETSDDMKAVQEMLFSNTQMVEALAHPFGSIHSD